jgi:hypothetical protein
LFVLEETDREFCSYPYQEAGAEAVMIWGSIMLYMKNDG